MKSTFKKDESRAPRLSRRRLGKHIKAVDISNLRSFLVPSDAPEEIIENTEEVDTVGQEEKREEASEVQERMDLSCGRVAALAASLDG